MTLNIFYFCVRLCDVIINNFVVAIIKQFPLIIINFERRKVLGNQCKVIVQILRSKSRLINKLKVLMNNVTIFQLGPMFYVQ